MIDLSNIKVSNSNIDEVYNKLIYFDSVNVFWLGIQKYEPVFKLQKKISENILKGNINDTILMLEHESVYTLGKNADENHILPLQNKCSDIEKTDRGGDVTYHGPGQLVCYPIVNLNNYNKSITWYIEVIEQSIIEVLQQNNISAVSKESPLVGVWVDDEKIAAIGVRLSRWVSTHGFAINVSTDLSYFDGIIPCGIFDYGVTSIENNIDKKIEVRQVAGQIEDLFVQKLIGVPVS